MARPKSNLGRLSTARVSDRMDPAAEYRNMVSKLDWTAGDLDQTADFARALAAALLQARTGAESQVVALVGPLGAGKTTLTRQICESLGVDPDSISSPTFALQNVYAGLCGDTPIAIHHYDWYRIGDEDELLETGIEETLETPGVHLIEWADRFPAVLPPDALLLRILPQTSGERQFQVTVGDTGGKKRFLETLERSLGLESSGEA